MKKLNLEHLDVESFDTLPPEASRARTVRAHEQESCPGQFSCDPSCNGTCETCVENTCGCSGLTCAADCTWDASCNKTCYGGTCYA